MKRYLVLFGAAALSCGGAVDSVPPAPDCSPGSTDVELVAAPADVEFPTCVEIPAHRERGSTSRSWCCWKGTVLQ